ncbi:YggT family protein [Actinophytocola glycyrrhizae]|uniref:YggT family protein n=1 Tax=Actinophytocola glycyrrhizae TaxID=2044873 RepID=A0ABV9S9V1_9PSEU
MDVIGTLLGYALTVFVVLMIARMLLDWAGLVSHGSPWMRRARTIAHAGTEPVIAPVRRVLRPVRAGGLSIDLAFTAVFVLALILRGVAFSL